MVEWGGGSSLFHRNVAIMTQISTNVSGKWFADCEEFCTSQFVQMELKDNTEKSHRFHETDSQITSEDLWLSWQQNEGTGARVSGEEFEKFTDNHRLAQNQLWAW